MSSPGVGRGMGCSEVEKGLISGKRAPDFRPTVLLEKWQEALVK